jgi:hypothetical protein
MEDILIDEFIENYLEDGNLAMRISYEYGFEPRLSPEYQTALDWLNSNNIRTVADFVAIRRKSNPVYKLPSQRRKELFVPDLEADDEDN